MVAEHALCNGGRHDACAALPPEFAVAEALPDQRMSGERLDCVSATIA